MAATPAHPPTQGAAVERSGPVSLTPTGSHASTGKLMLMAAGVVFGDIGTSPLYALRSASTDSRRRAGAAESSASLLARLLVADDGRHREVPGVRHARGQPRRRRHPRAPCAHAREAEGDVGAHRRIAGSSSSSGAALLYGDGSSRRPSACSAPRGLEVATPRPQAHRRAHHVPRPALPLRGPAARDRRARHGLRAGHGHVVPGSAGSARVTS